MDGDLTCGDGNDEQCKGEWDEPTPHDDGVDCHVNAATNAWATQRSVNQPNVTPGPLCSPAILPAGSFERIDDVWVVVTLIRHVGALTELVLAICRCSSDMYTSSTFWVWRPRIAITTAQDTTIRRDSSLPLDGAP